MSVTAPQIQNVLQQLQATASQAGQMPGQGAGINEKNHTNANFAGALVTALNKIDGVQDAANAQAKAFERGEPGVSISNVMIDLQKASLTFNMGMQVRNKLVTAYKDVMAMQV